MIDIASFNDLNFTAKHEELRKPAKLVAKGDQLTQSAQLWMKVMVKMKEWLRCIAKKHCWNIGQATLLSSKSAVKVVVWFVVIGSPHGKLGSKTGTNLAMLETIFLLHYWSILSFALPITALAMQYSWYTFVTMLICFQTLVWLMLCQCELFCVSSYTIFWKTKFFENMIEASIMLLMKW